MSRSLSWRRAIADDLPALEAYLRSREEEAAGFIFRILKGGRIRMPSWLRGGLIVATASPAPRGDGTVHGAILKTSTGLAFPLLPAEEYKEPDRAILAALSEGLASVVGPGADVDRFERMINVKPLVAVSYELMSRPSALGLLSREGPRGFSVQRADSADLEDLYPLQEAYEKEEVLTAIHRFDAAGCRAGLAKSLRDQLLLVGSLDGHAVAKAATNAHAFSLDQLGGIFVAPPYRRQGLAEAIVASLVDRLAEGGKGSVLFVKRTNEAARCLYDKLGFEARGPFRADYFMPY